MHCEKTYLNILAATAASSRQKYWNYKIIVQVKNQSGVQDCKFFWDSGSNDLL